MLKFSEIKLEFYNGKASDSSISIAEIKVFNELDKLSSIIIY